MWQLTFLSSSPSRLAPTQQKDARGSRPYFPGDVLHWPLADRQLVARKLRKLTTPVIGRNSGTIDYVVVCAAIPIGGLLQAANERILRPYQFV